MKPTPKCMPFFVAVKVFISFTMYSYKSINNNYYGAICIYLKFLARNRYKLFNKIKKIKNTCSPAKVHMKCALTQKAINKNFIFL